LLTGKDKTLLIWRNTFFVLDLLLDIVNSVGGFDLKGDGLTSKGLDENLYYEEKIVGEVSKSALDI